MRYSAMLTVIIPSFISRRHCTAFYMRSSCCRGNTTFRPSPLKMSYVSQLSRWRWVPHSWHVTTILEHYLSHCYPVIIYMYFKTSSWLPAPGWAVQEIQGLSEEHNDSVWHHTLWTGNIRDGQNWLAFHMQVSCRRVCSRMHSGVGGQTGSAQIWSTIHQQLRVPDLPPDVSITDWASCRQQVTLVMMRPSYRRLSPWHVPHHHKWDLLWARSQIRERDIRWQIWHSKLLVDGGPDLRRSRWDSNSWIHHTKLFYCWLARGTPISSVHRECFQFKRCDAAYTI